MVTFYSDSIRWITTGIPGLALQVPHYNRTVHASPSDNDHDIRRLTITVPLCSSRPGLERHEALKDLYVTGCGLNFRIFRLGLCPTDYAMWAIHKERYG